VRHTGKVEVLIDHDSNMVVVVLPDGEGIGYSLKSAAELARKIALAVDALKEVPEVVH
jgi:hypothetical protein